MPKGRKGGKSGPQPGFSDVTVYDFAHSESVDAKCSLTHRVKKATVNAVNNGVKQLQGHSGDKIGESNLSWYDQDLDDFEIFDDINRGSENGTCVCEEEDSKDCACLTEKRTVKTKRKKHRVDHDEPGIIYPQDVWFVLSQYIRPEDVITFAQICRQTHDVVHTAQFWRKLYHRFAKPVADLPLDLRPCSMATVGGLRAKVIRALYIKYEPFHCRIVEHNIPFKDELYSLEGGKCQLMWHTKNQNHWQFYIKIHQEYTSCWLQKSIAKSPRLEGEAFSSPRHHKHYQFNNVFYNCEDGCRILQITTLNFIPLPMSKVLGLRLVKVFLNVSSNMRYHKLKLVFGSYRAAQHAALGGTETIVMDPVVDAKVFNWWHPKYSSLHVM